MLALHGIRCRPRDANPRDNVEPHMTKMQQDPPVATCYTLRRASSRASNPLTLVSARNRALTAFVIQ